MSQDSSQRFIVEKTDIRGEWVHLERSYQEILAIHRYPPAVALLLGEFLAASVHLYSTIKFEGRLIMQVRGKGDIALLMAEASSDKKIRAIARVADSISSSDFAVLFQDATLVVTVEPANGEKYQSLVPLKGDNLATCLEHYFEQSEQLTTFIKLAANGEQAAGILLQQLPKQLVMDDVARDKQWQHASILGRTAKPEELLSLGAEQLLNRLYVGGSLLAEGSLSAEGSLKLLAKSPIEFQCSCTKERTARALMVIDPDELDLIFQETPLVEMSCEFCLQKYEFSRESLAEIVRGNTPTH